jgi:hypothetical protein
MAFDLSREISSKENPKDKNLGKAGREIEAELYSGSISDSRVYRSLPPT